MVGADGLTPFRRWKERKFGTPLAIIHIAYMYTRPFRHGVLNKMDLLENYPLFAHKIVLQCLYLARIGRPDISWSVNKLARAFTKWTKACDKRLARLISYIHHTSEFRQYCDGGNTAPM